MDSRDGRDEDGTPENQSINMLPAADGFNSPTDSPSPTIVLSEPEEPEEPTLEPDSDKPQDITGLISSRVDGKPIEEVQMVAKLGIARTAIAQNFVGLSNIQRKFLYNRALVNSDSEACRLVGTTVRTLGLWQRENSVFSRAYASLWVDPSSFTITMLDILLPKSAEVLEEALSAESMKDRLKAVEIIFKSKDILKPGETPQGNEAERALVRRLIERGAPIPPQLQGYVEGEFREVTVETVESTSPKPIE